MTLPVDQGPSATAEPALSTRTGGRAADATSAGASGNGPAAAAAPAGRATARRQTGWLSWFIGRRPPDEGGLADTTPPDPPWVEVAHRDFFGGAASIQVLHNPEKSRYMYRVVEPRLDPSLIKSLAFVREVLNRTFDVDLDFEGRGPSKASVEALRTRIDKAVKEFRLPVSDVGRQKLHYFLERDFLGNGPIDLMMRDPDLEDISCDGPGVPVFLYHRRHGSMESNVLFKTAEDLDGFVIRMAQRSGKQITISEPMLDSSLPDGSRLQATLGREVTDNGSTFTIRRFNESPFTPIDLVRMGTLNAQILAYFWLLVQHGANIIFAGGTASGKTTALNAISLFIPPQSKIVSIEDTREINLPHANWVRSVTRGGSRGTDTKRVDMFDLLSAALRQRPEYILVGEVRGKEATVAFQAMATGHAVYATIHADSARSVVYRLENEPINIPRIVLQALDVIGLQSLVVFQGKRLRRLQQVVEVVGIDPSTRELLTHTPFVRDAADDSFHYAGRSYKLERIAQRMSWSKERLESEFRRRTEVIEALVGCGQLTFDQIAVIVATAQHQPDLLNQELDRLRQLAKAVGA